MGGADAVPGVSGGTIALITGIYEKLLASIKSFDLSLLKDLRNGKFFHIWQHINGTFLIILLSGIATSLLSLARLMIYLLQNYPIQLWSFFFGLIIISSIIVLKEINQWDWGTIAAIVLGGVIAFGVTSITPAETPKDLWFVFISGAIALCSMILPGISGAFILLILGKYEYIYGALKDFNLPVILTFVTGGAVGLLSFSKILSWLLEKHHHITIATLSGFMIGSLNKIWPWKNVVSYRLNSHGEQVPLMDENVMPPNYLNLTGQEPLILQAILFMTIGILMVILITKIAQLKTTSQ